MNQSSDNDATLIVEPAPPAAHPFAWLPYARLLRIPNVFTALADIPLAGLVSGAITTKCALAAARGAGVRVPVLQRHGLERLLRRGAGRARTALPPAAIGPHFTGHGQTVGGGTRWPSAWRWPAWRGCGRTASRRAADLGGGAGGLRAAVRHLAEAHGTGAGGHGRVSVLQRPAGLAVAPISVGGWGVLLALVVGVYIVGVTWFRTGAGQFADDAAGRRGGDAVALVLALAVPTAGPRAARR